MSDKLENLTALQKLLVLLGLVALIPVAGWLAYRFGFFLGSN